MDNVRASNVKRKLFDVQTEEDRLAFQPKICRYINGTFNFERRWNFNLCEQRPVHSALISQWEVVIDQEDVPFIHSLHRNSIINAGDPSASNERVTKLTFSKLFKY